MSPGENAVNGIYEAEDGEIEGFLAIILPTIKSSDQMLCRLVAAAIVQGNRKGIRQARDSNKGKSTEACSTKRGLEDMWGQVGWFESSFCPSLRNTSGGRGGACSLLPC